ncbi:5-formyltetrahydrofolate cyclo-ligase [Ferrimonas sediminum]|uniref:5-formyltetrahydrofolate cyclo-ligase n=1 Tax=Ferrimonas sediminum TaxID=718193 RepID=A0A1G8T0N3_9GAMM|nr:5-formyltetrahydrofolate cyclo-ligase [Ferrimonas sediminum]SDJ34974.1 5-formyltetrahydrofolate cyclo-ligase [Ferrimonas sediminum]
MTCTDPRHTLRQQLRQARRALTPAQHLSAAEQLSQRLSQHPQIQHAKVIALYLPQDGEPDLQPLSHRLWQQGKTLALPVMHPFCRERMLFQRYAPDTRLKPNHFGIAEPYWNQSELILKHQMEVMLMPLVGFDAQGHRLGMGGGFYDRFLAGPNRPCHLIGIAHQCQQVSALPPQPWDIDIDAIATPEQWIECRPNP